MPSRAHDLSVEELWKQVNESLLHLQAWLVPGSMKWSRDGLDAAAELRRRADAAPALADALEKAADTFADMAVALDLLRHGTAAQAARIAEDYSRAALSTYRGET